MAILLKIKLPNPGNRFYRTIFITLPSCFTVYIAIYYVAHISLQQPVQGYFRNPSIHRNDNVWFDVNYLHYTSESANELLLVYKQQLSRLVSAPFLPTYQNQRLTLKLNIPSIATNLFGNVERFEGSNRHLRIVCLEILSNSSTFGQSFVLNLHFKVTTISAHTVKLTLLPRTLTGPYFTISPLPANQSIETTNVILIDVNKTFPVNTVLRFTYQWTDFDTSNFFDWPQWPLQRPCIDSFLYNITQNRRKYSKLYFPCSVTNVLVHSTSRQLFTAEQTAVRHWLDLQYNAAITYPSAANHRFSNQSKLTMKTRRLSPFEMSLNPSVCSSKFHHWILKYHQWHENISSILSQPSITIEQQRDHIVELSVRFILYEQHFSGMADRITHLITTYLVAVLTNRLFIFDPDWPEFGNVMQPSLNYDEQFVIPWFVELDILNNNLSENDSKYFTSRSHWFSVERYRRDYNYDKEFPERILTFKGHTGGVVQTIASNTSIYHKFLTDDLHMNPDNLFGCLYHSLFTYRLAALIETTSANISADSVSQQLGHSSQQILQTLLSPTWFPIGLQVRTGDINIHLNDMHKSNTLATESSLIEQFQNYFTCARGIVVRNEKFLKSTGLLPIIYLVSDAVPLRQAALRRWQLPTKCFHSFGNECQSELIDFRILANPNVVLHMAYTSHSLLAFQLAMFDLFLFSLCEQHIITTQSGFGRIGVFASLKRRNIYSILDDEKLLCINDTESISLALSARYWSGI